MVGVAHVRARRNTTADQHPQTGNGSSRICHVSLMATETTTQMVSCGRDQQHLIHAGIRSARCGSWRNCHRKGPYNGRRLEIQPPMNAGGPGPGRILKFSTARPFEWNSTP
jgi:hypothetical protein